MHLVIGLLLLVFAFLNSSKEKAEAKEELRKRDVVYNTDEWNYIDPWEEYVVHCGNVAKVNQMIAEEEAKTVVTDSDVQFVRSIGWLFDKEEIKPIKVVGNVWLKVIGKPMPLNFLVKTEQRRNQIAYYLTIKDVVLKHGKKTQKMYGQFNAWFAKIWEYRDKPEFEEKLQDLFCRENTVPRLYCCDGKDGIQYPNHDHPHMELKPYFWAHKLQNTTFEEVQRKQRS